MTVEEMPAVLTVSDICAALRVSRPTVYDLIRSNRLAAFKVGRAIRCSRQSLLNFINQQEAPPVAAGE
jgi:excisionase family DNA binding protein